MAHAVKNFENDWSDIPGCTGYDPAMGKLTLRDVEAIPDEVFEFARHNSVKILDASDNPALKTLPDNFSDLEDLERAFFSSCGFDEVPPQLRECEQLKMLAMKFCGVTEFGEDVLPPSMDWLILTGNEIEQLPASIGDLVNLKKVALAGNPLTGLPEEMKNCREIELLRVSAADMCNPTPQWVFELPKLAFFSDGGNPASRAYPEIADTSERIHWKELSVGEQVGASPSSEVFKGEYNGQAIAPKVFREGLASDGYAEDDFACSLLAGNHPNLREVTGRAVGHPEGRDVIVTKLIPQGEYVDLGKPPNFDTVTRDTFEDGVQYEPWFVQSVLLNVAQAMLHLHKRNIAHGDLYAHNIQVNGKGHAIVGDFGAATYYDPYAPTAHLREAQDVRAFGYLIEDMLDRMQGTQGAGTLTGLRLSCVDENPEARPSFQSLVISLEHMPQS